MFLVWAPVLAIASPQDHGLNYGFCPASTINHLTHALPKLCHAGDWVDDSIEATARTQHHPHTIPSTGSERLATSTSSAEDRDQVAPDAHASPFMSFEDWKAVMLQRTGQDPQELRARKASDPDGSRDQSNADDGQAWGDEEEIDLEFVEYGAADQGTKPRDRTRPHDHSNTSNQDTAVISSDDMGALHRSKDAGKTCKERFSYASFDAGATILKTGPETKNAKAILVENKDTYMLLECEREKKFVIIELSDDILLDTVVVANFEFFSSMIRHFRLSVSDRYPVKSEKWKELGTFETRNTREIQAFLIEDPKIWAKYVRFEFLTHYGKEYYCPVSLIRVHGSRMLDSWKEEGGRDDDMFEDDEKEALQCNDSSEVSSTTILHDSTDPPQQHHDTSISNCQPTPIAPSLLFGSTSSTCPAYALYEAVITSETGQRMTRVENVTNVFTASEVHNTDILKPPEVEKLQQQEVSVTSDMLTSTKQPSSAAPTVPSEKGDSAFTNQSYSAVTNTQVRNVVSESVVAQATQNSVSTSTKSRNSGVPNSPSASPTVQGGFFNSVTKRLQQVEANLTLSMKYIEDQSRYMQEVMQQLENKRSQKVAATFEHFNHTLQTEMHNLHEQYEQLWQSTIIAIESQKGQSERDVVALSTRLNLLADEVVFQKRMAIAQAIILLSCLILVIFSRGVALPQLAPTLVYGNEPTASTEQPRRHYGSPSRNCPHDSHDSSFGRMTPRPSVEPSPEQDLSRGASDLVSGANLASWRPSHHPHHGHSLPLALRAHGGGSDVESETSGDEVNTGQLSRQPASEKRVRKPLPALPEHPL